MARMLTNTEPSKEMFSQRAPLQWLPTKTYQNLTIEVEPFSGFDRSLPFEGFSQRFW